VKLINGLNLPSMRFSFKECPSWFTNYVVDEFLDEFHSGARATNAVSDSLNDPTQRDKLLDYAVEFFTAKEICVKKQDRQIWFDIDENDPKYFWLILKWSE